MDPINLIIALFKFRDISIRNKLIFMLVFTSLLVLVIFFTVFIITDVRAYKQRKVNSMTSLSQVIGANSVSPILFQDNEAARAILEELHNVAPEILHAGILDSSGNFFANYTKPGAGDFHIPGLLSRETSLFANDKLYVSNDIINPEGSVIGKVVLEVELTDLAETKRSKYEVAAILLVIALGFSFLIAITIQTYISKRLLNLVGVMKDVAKTGDYSKTITDDGKDEISTLVDGFNTLLQQVKENQRKKDEFISIASHELKTPLTTIKGYLDLLNTMEEKQPNKQFVQRASDNVVKLEKLIRDLLDVSKIQSGQLELNMKDFNMDVLLDETIAATQMVTGTHNISRENHLGNEIITADRQRIEQVLTNLLSNAIKYSPGEKKVVVYSYKTDTELVIKVRDFGIGVPQEEHSNIFERFYRTKDISQTITGFGLGLYICRDIIKRHHGKIWVETESKGSAFYFSLPLKKSAIPSVN